MTRFETATGQGKYRLSFETDNYEHYEYMQRAARFCVDGHFFGANLNFQQLQEELARVKNECDRLQKEVKMYASVNDSLIGGNEELKVELKQCETLWRATTKTLQDEIDRLTAELAHERQQQSNVAAACSDEQCECNQLRTELDNTKAEAEHAKLMFNVAFSYLEQTGYDVEKLGHIVALRCALEERGLV